jgi:hypothetical protein
MSTSNESILTARVRVMRIIMIAYLTGVTVFAAISLVLGNRQAPPAVPVVTYTAIAFGAVLLLASAIVPNIVVTTARRKMNRESPGGIPIERWCDVYQTRLIVGAAMLIGPTFLFLIAYLIESNPLNFLAIVFIIALLMKFPTRSGIERWIEEQRQLCEQEQLPS